MGATLTAILPHVTEHVRKEITNIFFEDGKDVTPILASMETKSSHDGAGRQYVVPVTYGQGSSVSATFSTAQAKSQGTTPGNTAARDRWTVSSVKLEGTCQWDRDALLAAEGGPEEAYFDVLNNEMKARIGAMRKRIAMYTTGDGFGAIGTITATSTTTITISSDLVNRVQYGDNLVASSANAGAAWRNTASAIVIGYEPSTGVITLGNETDGSAINPGGTLSWAVNDYIFFKGDHTNDTNSTAVALYGLSAWIPPTAPTGAFCGITRTGIPELSGIRYAVSGTDHATSLILAAQRLLQFGSKADMCFVSPKDYAILCADKESTKIVSVELGKYKISFDGVILQTAAGNIPVVPDVMVPQGTAWMGPFSDKRYAPYFIHNADLINIDDLDGNQMLRLASSTAFEMRLWFRGNMVCPAPGKFCVISGLPSS